jgi:hypothetical protein
MSSKHVIEEARPREPTLEEESAMFGDDDLMDSMNLATARTGIEGVVFISTVMGAHGPRVKYYEKTGKGQNSFSVSIAASPAVLATSLPDRTVQRMAPQVIEWVHRNRQLLLEFWNEGAVWSEEQVDAFRAVLKKV